MFYTRLKWYNTETTPCYKKLQNSMTDAALLLRQIRMALQNQDYPEAIRNLEEAASAARSMGDIGAEGRHLANLALIYYRLSQHKKALEYFDLALARARAEQDRATENGLLGNIGNILREQGQHQAALDHLNQALIIAQEIGDVRGRGLWLGNLGLVYDDLKQYDKAAELHAGAVDVARQLQDQRGLALRLGHLGASCEAMGDYAAALRFYQEAAQLLSELGEQSALGERLRAIADLYAKVAREDQAWDLFAGAAEHYQMALELAQDRQLQAELLAQIGGVLADGAAVSPEPRREIGRAMECYTAAAKRFAVLGLIDQGDAAQQKLADLRVRLRQTRG
jgi:tetratricopeptide (TPR) repeat protein